MHGKPPGSVEIRCTIGVEGARAIELVQKKLPMGLALVAAPGAHRNAAVHHALHAWGEEQIWTRTILLHCLQQQWLPAAVLSHSFKNSHQPVGHQLPTAEPAVWHEQSLCQLRFAASSPGCTAVHSLSLISLVAAATPLADESFA